MHAQRNVQRNVPYVVLFLVHHRQVYSEEGLDLNAGLQQGACIIAVRTVQVKHVRTVYGVQEDWGVDCKWDWDWDYYYVLWELCVWSLGCRRVSGGRRDGTALHSSTSTHTCQCSAHTQGKAILYIYIYAIYLKMHQIRESKAQQIQLIKTECTNSEETQKPEFKNEIS